MADTDARQDATPGGRSGLKIHHLRPAPGSHIQRTRVGRGEASKGKTAGRGTKGSKARTQVAPGLRGRPDAAAPAAAQAQGLLEPAVQDDLPGGQPRPADGAVPRRRGRDARGPGAPGAQSGPASWSRYSARATPRPACGSPRTRSRRRPARRSPPRAAPLLNCEMSILALSARASHGWPGRSCGRVPAGSGGCRSAARTLDFGVRIALARAPTAPTRCRSGRGRR